MDIPGCQRMLTGIVEYTNPGGRANALPCSVPERGDNNIGGGDQTAKEASNSSSATSRGSVPEPDIHSPKAGWVIPTSNKFKTFKSSNYQTTF